MICGWKGGRCAHDAILDTRSLKIERAKEALAYLDLSPLPSFPCPPRLASRDLRAGISLFRARNKLLPNEKWVRKSFRKLWNCIRSMKHREGYPIPALSPNTVLATPTVATICVDFFDTQTAAFPPGNRVGHDT